MTTTRLESIIAPSIARIARASSNNELINASFEAIRFERFADDSPLEIAIEECMIAIRAYTNDASSIDDDGDSIAIETAIIEMILSAFE